MRQIQFCGYGKFDLRAFIFKGAFLLSLELKENTDICNKHKVATDCSKTTLQ